LPGRVPAAEAVGEHQPQVEAVGVGGGQLPPGALMLASGTGGPAVGGLIGRLGT
jgi:hypothetical protein